ncbi:AAA family ATPase [Blautia sp. MSJ-19]|uniref:AAA family ATPase n=1 Tax=Blautia sp. MSJ-19 TaxID=2841517 RepID=UPI001C0ECA73|nr:AAA family ATPase [Blautia sp. MSJ-19]MBU5481585.1 AAA family ATPase [Blautia sp. MSJ-19]
MKSISIYTITREQTIDSVQKLERQLSGREYFLKIRDWELESMKALVKKLGEYMPDVYTLCFFYSFQIPRLGKEFDLLQIKEEQIVNIELKSGVVSDEAIRKQLIQNRYYLSVLGKPIQSYTYISSQDRLVKLTNHDHIIETDWEHLCIALKKESPDYHGDVEDLFQAELYLISPLTEPARFLGKEYFLTSQQRDIERQILKKIRAEHTGYFWFSGLPGTGKSLLLYDIAMKLSVRQRVCMIHCGEAGRAWKVLHERLQRIDFWADSQVDETADLTSYSAILIDETHLLSTDKLDILLNAVHDQRPVILSSDSENMISPEEMDNAVVKELENLPGIQKFHLTDRIRTNAELSSFIQNIMHLPEKRSPRCYPHIEAVCANDETEAENLLQDYIRRGYTYQNKAETSESVNSMALRDTERLVVLLDERYYYDEAGYLRTSDHKSGKMSDVRILFHQLNRAKENLALIIKNNAAVYEKILDLLQMYPKTIRTKKK